MTAATQSAAPHADSVLDSRMDDKALDRFCWQWNLWCLTRKFYIAPGCKSLLGRMQPGKVSEPPDAHLSSDLAYFNMAVHALADMPDSEPECFVAYYALAQQTELPIKRVASQLGISSRTFYERKAKFARRALLLAKGLRAAATSSQALDCHDNID